MNYGLVTILGTLLAGMSVAVASEVNLQGRGYTYSCGYFSSSAADFSIGYRNDSLPWGSRVFVIYGFGGYREFGGGNRSSFEWADRAEVEAFAVAPSTWSGFFSKTTHARSSDRFINAIQFVIRVQLPDGREIVEHGSESQWGFFESNFYFSSSSHCIDVGHPKMNMQEMPLRSVVRN